MTASASIGVGILGMGFMGQTHVRAYQAAAAAGLPCRVVAVADLSPARLTGAPDAAGNIPAPDARPLFDPAAVRTYLKPDDLLSDPAVALVSICTYTDTHVEYAERAMVCGKHVLVEKPVSLDSGEVRRLAEMSKRTGRVCMPAMCMRFWPGWTWLRDRIRDRSFGGVKSAVFQRLGSGPKWGQAFYRDTDRSGGALFDMHVHDADFVLWCFGKPDAVASAGSLSHVTTLYRFREGPGHVTAEAAWDLAPAAGFRMRFTVAFDRATAEYDLARRPRLTLHRGDATEPVPLDDTTGYEPEIAHVVESLAAGKRDLRASLEEAVIVTELLEAERRSLRSGNVVDVRGE